MGYLESLNEIKQAKDQRNQNADELYKLQMKYIALERQHKGQLGDKAEAQLKELEARIEKWSAVKKDSATSVNELIGRLYERLKPQQLIEEWQDNLPITLLPVRMETKYRQTERGIQLMVRIYPDDIAVITHETMLTETERAFGLAHWKILFNNPEDPEIKRKAWKLIADKFGVNRSAWVAKSTKPLNWAQWNTLASQTDLTFEDIETKPDSWTMAAHTNMLPDRFVLMGYRDGKEVLSELGMPIKDIVTLGPAPIIDKNDPSFTRDELDNRIQYGEEYAWMADFNLAVQQGLGFVIPQTQESAAQGYDQLLVLGIKISADENESKQLLEDLIDNHRYSQEGLSLLKQGTPTNNTESDNSGFQNHQSIEDMSLEIETGQQLFIPTENPTEASDGQRLAEYLGLDYHVFQSVQNSNITDHKEAMAMNTALHPGTLGYFTTTMLNGVLNEQERNLLRKHFIDFVSGRGALPAIRVGNQPYGIIVTSDFNDWQYQPSRFEHLGYNQTMDSTYFYEKMYQILKYMSSKWKEKAIELPQITNSGSAGETLLKILGLHPGSVDFFQRTGYSYDYLDNLEKFKSGGTYFADTILMFMQGANLTQLLKSWGYSTLNKDGSKKTPPMLLEIIFQHYTNELDKNNVVDIEPLSEEKKIKGYQQDSELNYIDWLVANMANDTALEAQNFGDQEVPKTLLFMMLKNGLLLETNHSIFKYLETQNIQASELIHSRKFMNISTAASISPWEIYKAPVNKLVKTEVSNSSLFSHMHSKLANSLININLTENKWALNILKNLPTANLHRTFTEHLDVLSYRLDAWQSSLFDHRITNQRNIHAGTQARKKGTYLGSYGYLENVKMRSTRKKIDESVLPQDLQEQENNLYTESNNGGYVHAPSLNHATAAAILRNGYLTHASKDDAGPFSVNLSSERVRRAKAILEGVRNGQTLEALLGYQFERGMHDWSTRNPDPVILNQLKPDFRNAFPIKKTKVPQEGKTTGPEEITENYNVVNGLALAQVILPFPFGLTNLPVLNQAQIKALEQEKNQLKNTLDAVKDLLTAESAYQMATGNFERAAAVMQAISNGNIPPEVEVINTARSTQMTFTNRIVVNFDAALTSNPWPTVSPSAKSRTEPALNHWIGQLLGDPQDIICIVSALDAAKNEVRTEVSLDKLNLQPLDFVFLIFNKMDTSGDSELESRIRYYFLGDQHLSDDTIVNIQFSSTDSPNDLSKKSFAEILPFASYIHKLIGNSRASHAEDFNSTLEEEQIPTDNPRNINLIELQNKTNLVYHNYVETPVLNLEAALQAINVLESASTIKALRNALKDLADIGFTFAFPNSAIDQNGQAAKKLTEQAKTVLSRMAEITKFYNEQNDKLNPSGVITQESGKLVKMIQTIFGDNFIVLPKFNFNNPSEVHSATSSSASLLNYAKKSSDPALGPDAGLGMSMPVAEFLHSASLVREKMHTLEMVRLLNQNFNDQEMNGQPVQIPYKKLDSWLAVEFPKDTELLHDTISYVQYAPQGFDANAEQSGLLLDEWTETIPNPEEVSGITFNYNQPNSAPPQAILLAVTPKETGQWKWAELTNSVLNTFQRAKERAIEPDDVDKMPNLTTLLPATMAEFSASKFTNISLDYSWNILAKFKEIRVNESKK